VITSPQNEKLKLIRKLHGRRERERSGLFVAEGEDLIAAAADAGVEPELLLVAGEDVSEQLLDSVSALGSGTRVIGVYRQRRSDPGGELSVYLHGVGDPGNVGTIIRAAHALADGPVVVGPGTADAYSPKAVRASMGSIFARPPARGRFEDLPAPRLALHGSASRALAEVEPRPPLILCIGAERAGLPTELLAKAELSARIPLREGGPDSLNAAMAASIGLYELGIRMAARA
jgi:RNA methyltransferase, TrmH family